MTNDNISSLLSQNLRITDVEANNMLSALLSIVSRQLQQYKRVSLPQLGYFWVKKTNERVEANLSTGERILYPPQLKVELTIDKGQAQISANKANYEGETIGIEQLSTMLGEQCNKSTVEAETFIKQFVTMFSKEILLGNEIFLTGFGRIIYYSSEKNSLPIFEAVEPFAKQVNKPFAFFKPTLLNEGVSFPELEAKKEKETAASIPEKTKQNKRKYVFAAISIGVVAMVFLLFNTNKQADNVTESRQQTAVVQATVDTIIEQPAPAIEIEPAQPTEPAKPEVIAVETMGKSDWLAKYALKHYGHKTFWVYIYKYNKIKPSELRRMPIGKKIKIPAPHIYNIDAKNKASVDLAKKIASDILTE